MMKKIRTCNNFKNEEFRHPSSFFYPAYFWVWNDRLNKKNIDRQLKDMRKQMALSVCPLPEPKEFRPNSMKTMMSPGYLTKKYFEIYKYMVDQAESLGMDVWLYDEGGWPSGSACGRVVSNNPSLIQKVVRKKGSDFVIEAVNNHTTEKFNKPPYPDLLNPQTAKKFI